MGGDTICVPVSALKKEGIDDLFRDDTFSGRDGRIGKLIQIEML